MDPAEHLAKLDPAGSPEWKHEGTAIRVTGRDYLKTHPLAFCFAVSMAISGVLILALPVVRSSLSLQTLPEALTYALGALSLLGGLSCAYGLWSLKARFEGAGFTALGATQLVILISTASSVGISATLLGIALRGGLAVGCFIRAMTLVRQP